MNTKRTQIETDVDGVHEIGRHIARGDTLDEALAATVSFAVALVNCDRCFIYVREGEELALWVWKHLDQGEPEHTKLPLGKGIRLCWRNIGCQWPLRPTVESSLRRGLLINGQPILARRLSLSRC